MNETPQDLEALQQLLDRSIEQAGEYLRSCFEMPQHSLNARQIVHRWQAFETAAIATVTAKGEPRVAPVGCLFHRAEFHIPTVRNSTRAKHVAKRPGISLTFFERNDLALIVHGRGKLVTPAMPEFEELERLLFERNGKGVLDWGDGVYLRIVAESFYTFARYPERFPG